MQKKSLEDIMEEIIPIIEKEIKKKKGPLEFF